jgi:hypothetical protein
MKNLIKVGLISVIFVFTSTVNGQTGWPKEVTVIKSESNKTVSASGDLANGKLMEDLSWASSSSNACFPATQNIKYRGNHVFFATTFPPRSIMKIVVTPDDESANMSLYGYRIGNTDYSLVPDLARSITCESNEKWDRPWKNKVQTHERNIEFQNPSQNTYNILIGVSAPKGVTTGKFKVSVILES